MGNNDSSNGDSKATWLEADSSSNPFGVRLLSLMANLQMQSFTQDQAKAACAISWRPGHHDRLKPIEEVQKVPCNLRYPIAAPFPDGMLFIPRAMEDKWVIAWRDGKVLFARSWSGETVAMADAVVEGGELRISQIYVSQDSFPGLGEPTIVVDWMIRSHALEERLPLPVDNETAELLHNAPLLAMNAFGHRLFCAGLEYKMPPPTKKLYSLGALSAAVYANDDDAIRKLAHQDTWATAVAADGSPPLVLASQLGYTDLCRTMLELGADIEAKNGRGGSALQMSVVGKCSMEHVSMLIDAGANLESANADGFTTAHAAAEVDHAEVIPVLSRAGANLEAQTNAGYRPIHIAAGLGHQSTAAALLNCSVDYNATANGQNALQIARSEGQVEFAEWFAKVNKQ